MSRNWDNAEPRQLYLMAVHEAGMHVFLGDGSSWDIDPGSSTKVVFWSPSQLVRIEKDDNGYMLTNLNTITPDRVLANPGSWNPPGDDRIF